LDVKSVTVYNGNNTSNKAITETNGYKPKSIQTEYGSFIKNKTSQSSNAL
jgi:hypothetical protein